MTNQRPLARIEIREFTGLVSNRGSLLKRPGDAKVQVNVRSIKPGALEVRLGMRPVSFES